MAYGVAFGLVTSPNFGLVETNLVHIFGILNMNVMPCGLN